MALNLNIYIYIYIYIYNKFDIVSCEIAKTLLKTIEFPTDSTSFGRGCLQGT